MATGLHKDLAPAENHVAHSLEFANAAARNGFVASTDDVGRIAQQLDDDSFHILKNETPLTWEALGASISSPPTTHAFAGAEHSADTLANVNAKMSDIATQGALVGRRSEQFQRTTLVLDPTGTAADNVFTDWPSLMAAHGQITGQKRIQFAGPGIVTIPAGAYAIDSDTEFVYLSGPAPFNKTVRLASGVTFTGGAGPCVGQNIVLQHQGAAPVVTLASGIHKVYLDRGAQINCTGSAPYIEVTAAGTVAVFYMLNGSVLTGATHPVLNLSVSGAIGGILMFSASVVNTNVIEGVVGSTLFLQMHDNLCRFHPVQSGMAGTRSELKRGSRSYMDLNLHTATPPPTPQISAGVLYRFDTTSGPITVTLPAGNALNRGELIEFVLDIGTFGTTAANALTIAPAGSQTIDGIANYTLSTERGYVAFRYDGVSNWIVVGERT